MIIIGHFCSDKHFNPPQSLAKIDSTEYTGKKWVRA